MGSVSKITSKGQTTIPLEVRDYLQLNAGDRIRYEFVDGKVMIVAQNRSALSLAGVLYDPTRKPVTIDEMEEAIGDGIVKDYERSLDRR